MGHLGTIVVLFLWVTMAQAAPKEVKPKRAETCKIKDSSCFNSKPYCPSSCPTDCYVDCNSCEPLCGQAPAPPPPPPPPSPPPPKPVKLKLANMCKQKKSKCYNVQQYCPANCSKKGCNVDCNSCKVVCIPTPPPPPPPPPKPVKPKRAKKCTDKKSTCFNAEPYCPVSCPTDCHVDCNSCKTVCGVASPPTPPTAPPPPTLPPPPPPPSPTYTPPTAPPTPTLPPPPPSPPPPSPTYTPPTAPPTPTLPPPSPPPPSPTYTPPTAPPTPTLPPPTSSPPPPSPTYTPPTAPPTPRQPPPPPSPPPSSSGAKRVRCMNKKYPFCIYREHTCPDACANTCQVDCVTCSPVCNCNRPGAVCEDPKFIGADGITFYFHGKKEHDFCLVTDPNLHINGHFIGKRNKEMTRDFTWVQSLGILFDTHKLYIGARKTATWNDAVDRLELVFDGEPVSLPERQGASWSANSSAGLSITRTHNTNGVVIEAQGNFKIKAGVVPITMRDSVIHNYGISSDDCFAHLDLGFKFYSLSNRVNGVLGQTYSPSYISRVNVGAPMPVVGGDRYFSSSSLFSTDCSVSLFSGKPNLGYDHPDLDCATAFDGAGVVCKR